MNADSGNRVLAAIRTSLGRQAGLPAVPRPAVLPPRPQLDLQHEIDLFISEVSKLSGVARRLEPLQLPPALNRLVESEAIRRATLWSTPRLGSLDIAGQLERLGVEIIPANEDKRLLATCDLGVTEVDFALAETGTIGLLSSADKPRTVSLLPRVHLALLSSSAFCSDMAQVFSEAKNHDHLVFITGPSRTSDIELTVTLGVHGPKSLSVWVLA